MKRKILALMFIFSFLFSALTVTHFTNSATAQPSTIVYELPITVKILSPKNGTSFSADHFSLNLDITDIPQVNSSQDSFTFNVRVILDGNWSEPYSVDIPSKSQSFNYSANVTGLSNGSHSLRVSVYSNIYSNSSLTVLLGLSETINLTANAKVPIVSVVSPQNMTYDSKDVSLAFGTDEPIVWAAYSLDGGENMTVIGNTTLTGLSNGLHNLVVYANDTFGNMGASEIVTFRITVPESFPTLLIVAVTVTVVAVVCAGLLVYFNKRKQRAESASR